jgi:hypothetical protein
MGSIFTSDTAGFGALRIADSSWRQVDIGDLAGAELFDVLGGAVDPTPLLGEPDPKGKLGDLVGTYWAVLVLVSDRFIDVASAAGLSGWQTKPITLTTEHDASPLSLLQVTGRCGQIEKPDGFPRMELATWDGSDLFLAPSNATIFLSPTAVNVLSKAQLRNVEVSPPGVELV